MVRDPRSSDPTAAEPRQTAVLKTLDLRAVLIIFLVLVAMNATAFLGWRSSGALPAALIGIVGSWIGRREHAWWGFFAIAVGVSTSGALTTAVAERRFLRQDMTAQQILVEEAPRHPSGTLYSFRDGVVQTQYSYVHAVERQLKKRTERRNVHVAPLVPEGWDKRREVPAWVVVVGAESEVADWQQPYREAVRLDEAEWPQRTARDAVALASARHGLSSKTGAPLLRWMRDPLMMAEQRYQQALTWAALSIAGYSLLFLLGLSIQAGVRAVRRKR